MNMVLSWANVLFALKVCESQPEKCPNCNLSVHWEMFSLRCTEFLASIFIWSYTLIGARGYIGATLNLADWLLRVVISETGTLRTGMVQTYSQQMKNMAKCSESWIYMHLPSLMLDVQASTGDRVLACFLLIHSNHQTSIRLLLRWKEGYTAGRLWLRG